METTWSYSHTQLALYRLCPQRYRQAYILGNKEPKTPNMAFGTWMVHHPVETWLQTGSVLDHDWSMAWANFLAEFGGADDFDDPVFNVRTGKACLAAYQANPLKGEVTGIEEKVYEFIGGFRYVSKPDFILTDNELRRWSVDIKFTTVYDIKPLIPFDDQMLGQAVCTGADGFLRLAFQASKKTGAVKMLPPEGHLVDPVLKDGWLDGTLSTIRQIETERQQVRGAWAKNSNSCWAFGKACYNQMGCKLGS